ncbi:hypothetical protein IKG29_03045 [Candidatus Saccharibacteria bacterium]|nr:hypothetical protein [Candidatus Saccharibacteria bacterium]
MNNHEALNNNNGQNWDMSDVQFAGAEKQQSVDSLQSALRNAPELLSEDDYADSGINRNAEAETLEERQEKVSQAKAKVEESYKKSNVGESTSTGTEIVEDKSSSRKQLSLTVKRKLSKYDIAERSRVDRIKSDLSIFNISEYERRQIASQPSAFTKIVRLIADKLGIKTKRSEERREREAMHVALSEYHEEEAARRKAIEERKKAEALERERQNAEYEAEKARREKEALERDMATARNVFDYNKRDRFKKQRIQELVERDLNSHLLTVDNLEMEAISGSPEVQKRVVRWRKYDIPVYDLKGLPFSILSTTIDYRKANEKANHGTKNGPFSIGIDTYKTIMKNPWVWARRRDEAEKYGGFGTRNSNAKGDTISTSYWNSERNINSHVPGNLIYGFESVRADSIISVSNGDGGTSNMAGNVETTLLSPDAIKRLEGAGGTNTYNEVLLRRYTENGIPKKPDYIIVENGRITEESLRSAKYFGIPIVNIERSIYAEKVEKKGEELLASISENDTYEEMDEKIAELLSMSRYKSVYYTLNGIGRNYDIPRQINPTPLEKRCLEISQMEQLKRLDFIKNVLEEAIQNIESATEKGLPAERKLPGFDHFDVIIIDVQNQLWRTKSSDERDSLRSVPGNCNSIDINFKLKGSSRYVETCVYDGERIYKAEEALANGKRTKEDIENANSSFYNTLEPVVLKYFEAIRKNQRFRKTAQLGSTT